MQKIKTKWDPIRIQVPERVRKEEDMKTNYENAYVNLFRFLYEDKKRSPLYYDPYRLGGDTIIRYDGSHDFRCYELVHEFVEEAQKSGINPWQELKFGAQIKDNDWVRNIPPRVEFLPEDKTPYFCFIIRYNWKCE